jgi:hypothetical protein
LRVLHAYKVFPPDVVGGITEVIAYIAKGMAPRHESSLLVAEPRLGPALHFRRHTG